MKKKLETVINNFHNYKKIIFDCDGVVFDSNHLKNKIFKKVLLKENISRKHIGDFLNYHKLNGGMPRLEKFIYLEEVILKNKKKDISKRLLKSYGNFTKKMYIEDAKFVTGIILFLKIIKTNFKKINCYIVSGSDEKELISVFKNKGITKYFKKIYGSPDNKFQIISKKNLYKNYKQTLYFGDALMDYKVATYNNYDFVFVNFRSDFDYKKIKNKKLIVIKNFSLISKFVKKLATLK
mgnify:CR=1 FL=1|tara:strand:+ start:3372 stop:4082 length:711 start_codon:yes stop_codon:yes gene_type:complete